MLSKVSKEEFERKVKSEATTLRVGDCIDTTLYYSKENKLIASKTTSSWGNDTFYEVDFENENAITIDFISKIIN